VSALDGRIRAALQRVMAERRGVGIVHTVVHLGGDEHREHEPDHGSDERTAEVRDRCDTALEHVHETCHDKAHHGPGDRTHDRRDSPAGAALGCLVGWMWRGLHALIVPVPVGPETWRAGGRHVSRVPLRGGTTVSSTPDGVSYEVFTYVVVLQGGAGRGTLPITVCAAPGEAEHAARVIAYLELVVLRQGAEGGEAL
jgi:hypothetical protein